MTNPSYKPKPQETSELLHKELRRRGMSASEIETALKKKKRRKLLEFNAVQSRRAIPMPTNKAKKPSTTKPSPYSPSGRDPISDQLCTVEFAARQLKVHNKTLLRFIRDGRLPATRVGKSYRIRRTDLETFSGLPARADARVERASLTSIVDIPNVAADKAQRIARNVTAAINSKPERSEPLRVDVVHDIDRSHLKLIVVGSPHDAVNLLSLIRIWMDQ